MSRFKKRLDTENNKIPYKWIFINISPFYIGQASFSKFSMILSFVWKSIFKFVYIFFCIFLAIANDIAFINSKFYCDCWMKTQVCYGFNENIFVSMSN